MMRYVSLDPARYVFTPDTRVLKDALCSGGIYRATCDMAARPLGKGHVPLHTQP